MTAKISLCVMVKNEPSLEEFLLSINKYVDEIVIVDTGSTDNTTQETAKRYANKFEIFTDCNDPETGLINDFSLARERSFKLASHPWILWGDCDDIIEGGQNLQSIIESYEKSNYGLDGVAYLFPYEYSYDSAGECTCRHYREILIFNKNVFSWRNPVHEVLCPNDNVKTMLIPREEIVYKHRRQFSSKKMESGRNLRILKKYVEKIGDSDARQLYYLGLEYCNVGLLDDAINNLTKYIDISGWDDERAMACLKLVDIYQMLGNYQEGVKRALQIIGINEKWGEGYFAAARMFYYLALAGGPFESRNWERVVNFIRSGLALPPTKTLLFINPIERDCEIHKYLNVALNKLGDVKGALESVNIGIKKQPTDPNFVNNKKLYEAYLAKQDVLIGSIKLKELGELDQLGLGIISSILDKQPITMRSESVQNIEVKNSKLDIVFFIGNGVEEWTPESIKKTGMGGSETAAVFMSKLLVKNGNRVRVFNGCGVDEGIYDGVEYYRTDKYHDLECDVLIVSRQAPALADEFNIKSKLKLLWCHDLYAGGATGELLFKADRILALSNFHKQFLLNCHKVHSDHILVTKNGIDLNRFNKQIQRNKFKAINSSSPDRSWPVLLECWPEIKKQVPEAELHLFYGFKNWKFSAQHDQLQMDLITRLEKQILELATCGVVYHDRVNQDQLAEEFLSAGVMLHPTWFQETSGITFMEGQAAGLRIVSSAIGALTETVDDRGVLLSGEWTSNQYKANFIANAVRALKNEDDSDRAALQKYARENFSWDVVVENWQQMFERLIEELKSNPIIPFK